MKDKISIYSNLKNVGVLIAGIAIFYYLVIYLPSENRNKLRRQQLENEAEIAAMKPYNDCITDAANWYTFRNQQTQTLIDNCEVNERGYCKNGNGYLEHLQEFQGKTLLDNLDKDKKDCAIKFKK